MRYIISDIHGCYSEYRKLLNKINFSDTDELYILGDVVDRGPEPIRVLQDMMSRPNVFYILGNHDYVMLHILSKLTVVITAENAENHLSADDILAYQMWMMDGGAVTAKQFCALPNLEKMDILDYLREATAYETIEHDGKLYILSHAGISELDTSKELDEYNVDDFLWAETDYSKQSFPGNLITLVTGHTPTMTFREDGNPLVYIGNGHIALDCGCVFGGALAAYCVETGKVIYVKSLEKDKTKTAKSELELMSVEFSPWI